MRFLMLNWRDPLNPKSGGAERVTQAYLAELKRRGHGVFWYANEFPGCRPGDVIEGIEVVRGGASGSSVAKARQWYRRQARFDLVIDQHHGIPWYAPWWAGTRCVAYIHEVLGPIWDAFYPWPMNRVGRLQERWTHWCYRKVPFWTPSESTRQALLRTGVKEVKVIPNGVDTVPVSALEGKDLAQPVRLITVSRLAANKRVDHAIRALKQLLEAGVEATLTVVGGGESELALKELARELGIVERVVFTKQLEEEEKNRKLRQAHLLVHASIREGWGLNVIEANAMGTPAVVYPVAGLVDSTVHNETGLVTEFETPESLARTIRDLLETPREYDRLRVNAWKRSRTFAWDLVLPLACDWLEEKAAKRQG